MPTVNEKATSNRVDQLRDDHKRYKGKPAPTVHPNKFKSGESRKREAPSSSSPLAVHCTAKK